MGMNSNKLGCRERHFLSHRYSGLAGQNDNKINSISFAEDVKPVFVFKPKIGFLVFV